MSSPDHDMVLEFAKALATALPPLGVTYFEYNGMKMMFTPVIAAPSGIGTSPSDSLSKKDEDELERLMSEDSSSDPAEDAITYGGKPPGYQRPQKKRGSEE